MTYDVDESLKTHYSQLKPLKSLKGQRLHDSFAPTLFSSSLTFYPHASAHPAQPTAMQLSKLINQSS